MLKKNRKYKLNIDTIKIVAKVFEVNVSIWKDESKRPKDNFSFYKLRKSNVIN